MIYVLFEFYVYIFNIYIKLEKYLLNFLQENSSYKNVYEPIQQQIFPTGIMVGAMETKEVAIGDRLQVGEDRGFVLYSGPVPPSKGTWLGVDWDDPLRGKHDGVYAGTRYFQARL